MRLILIILLNINKISVQHVFNTKIVRYFVLFFHIKISKYSVFFFNKFIYLFILFLGLRCLAQVVAASGGYFSLRCTGFSWQWLLLLRSTGSRHAGFSSCGSRAQQLWLVGSRAQAQELWRMGLVAPRHVGSSRTRARTLVPSIGRRILNHCATREASKI